MFVCICDVAGTEKFNMVAAKMQGEIAFGLSLDDDTTTARQE